MEARLHYSRPLLLLQLQGPAVSPAPAPATAGGAVPDARPVPVPAPADAFTFLNANAIVILALLVCGLVASLALRAVLQCALRVTRCACRFHSGAGGAPEQDPGLATGGGGGGAEQAAAARRGGKQDRPRRETKLVRALPCLAYSAALARELAGSSRSECAICLAAFARGEAVRVLPRCGHGFHARCIDRWLAARPTCPTCRQAPFDQTTALLQPAVVAPLVRVVVVGDRVARLVEP
ncbi:RING-H2 finger protein ATL72-like [Panicum miliaceum]|uniref:RING-H2 finger protein ATL72-like n=1 Tax=Panicum miliaceum TaxID=4540 RepID=A0A3L6R617_PANMI|nr:RING-H2 finger protein ATL72-like [Panicum miliaceum]